MARNLLVAGYGFLLFLKHVGELRPSTTVGSGAHQNGLPPVRQREVLLKHVLHRSRSFESETGEAFLEADLTPNRSRAVSECVVVICQRTTEFRDRVSCKDWGQIRA